MSIIVLSAITIGTHTADQVLSAATDYINRQVLPEEGPYDNDPNDSGGETAWGVEKTEAVAWGYTGDMHNFTQAMALQFYLKKYFHDVGLDQLGLTNLPLSLALLDLGINVGDHTAVMFLQRLLKVLGYYTGKLDGDIGPMTCGGVKKFLDVRGQDGLRVLYAGIHGACGMRYIEIVESNPKDVEFIYGWLAERAYPEIKS